MRYSADIEFGLEPNTALNVTGFRFASPSTLALRYVSIRRLALLNRAALLLRYKEPAVWWINDADPSPAGKEVTLEDANSERPVYLISDEDAETSEAVRAWIEANFRALFESELEGWYTDHDLWPRKLSLELFDNWFSVECHSMLFDTVGGAIVEDET